MENAEGIYRQQTLINDIDLFKLIAGCYMFILWFLFQMKTVSVALVLCLNVGVDPPDVVKISPCARLECWIGRC